jgi:hypothetical protein
MKPTKEQLASVKWWEENAKLKDKYCYMNEKTGECFTTWHFDDGVNGFELLAKRPEPEWVPGVGDECEFKHPQFGWTGCIIIGPFRDAIVCAPNGGGFYQGMPSDYRPVKTEREELIDIVNQRELAENKAEAIADAILARFDLTEKDDN